MIGTQRPDKNAVDPQTKANLSGRLCFKMADNASSMTILDNGRATDLPIIPGRAVWQSGLDNLEVQAPMLSAESAKELIASHFSTDSTEAKDGSMDAPKKSERDAGALDHLAQNAADKEAS